MPKPKRYASQMLHSCNGHITANSHRMTKELLLKLNTFVEGLQKMTWLTQQSFGQRLQMLNSCSKTSNFHTFISKTCSSYFKCEPSNPKFSSSRCLTNDVSHDELFIPAKMALPDETPA
ncbi:hypothetical protein AVEN_23063-1 [Araneus ventricosus]|uniref:Uncharacterized protein n=1 Tax=Araneus ventricosus TaxID=182803 RepID=A0A4Y2IMH1_ARAVE|nr:hypothetical protein AVEN_23063-1 [Araneus ventricosus]